MTYTEAIFVRWAWTQYINLHILSIILLSYELFTLFQIPQEQNDAATALLYPSTIQKKPFKQVASRWPNQASTEPTGIELGR